MVNQNIGAHPSWLRKTRRERIRHVNCYNYIHHPQYFWVKNYPANTSSSPIFQDRYFMYANETERNDIATSHRERCSLYSMPSPAVLGYITSWIMLGRVCYVRRSTAHGFPVITLSREFYKGIKQNKKNVIRHSILFFFLDEFTQSTLNISKWLASKCFVFEF